MIPKPEPSKPELIARLRRAGCVWAEDEAAMLIESATSEADLEAKVERRVEGEPLELVLGWAMFRGLRINVRPGVFIPRVRTEFLAEQAVTSIINRENPVVVELCCGAGAISAALLNEAAEPVILHACDIDPIATSVARSNLPAEAHVHTGDLFEPLPRSLRGRVDVLVANVPYVPTADIAFLPAESRLHEPLTTVDGGADGLGLLKRLAEGAREWLAPDGRVMSEVSERQAPLAASIFAGQGLRARIEQDETLAATVVIGITAA